MSALEAPQTISDDAISRAQPRTQTEWRMRERVRLAFRIHKSGRFVRLDTFLNYGFQSAVEFTFLSRGRIIRRGFRFPTSAVTSPLSRVARGWPMYLARHAKPIPAIAREMREATD